MSEKVTVSYSSRKSSPKNVASIYDCKDDLNAPWRDKALCKTFQIPTHMFFDIDSGKYAIASARDALAACSVCPVQAECLYEAMKYNYDGVWGCTIYRQRLDFIRQYLNNDLNNLTLDDAKQFVQMARVINVKVISTEPSIRRRRRRIPREYVKKEKES